MKTFALLIVLILIPASSGRSFWGDIDYDYQLDSPVVESAPAPDPAPAVIPDETSGSTPIPTVPEPEPVATPPTTSPAEDLANPPGGQNETEPTVAPEPSIPAAQVIVQPSDGEEFGQLFDALLDMMLSEPEVDGGTKDEEPQVSTPMPDCKKEEVDPYSQYCALSETQYILQRRTKGSDAWALLFEIKDPILAENDTIGHYVVRVKHIQSTPNGDETRFVLVSWEENKRVITVDNFQAGDYSIQICAVTSAFEPTLVNNEGFSWEKVADQYRFRFQPSPMQEVPKNDAVKNPNF